MIRCARRIVLILAAELVLCLPSQSQTTYHFHKETASTGYDLLSTSGPDAASTTLTTTDLKQKTGTTWIANWATASGVPNSSGIVPANATFQFSLWMNKSTSNGTIYPVVTVGKLNSSATSWVTATATTALTTTLTKITFSFTLPAAQTMAPTDRWWVEVGAYIPSNGSTTHSVTASFAFEGTLNGNYDSTGVMPAILIVPNITGVTPSSGTAGTTVSIAGTGFGSSRGTGSVTFNGVAATISTWGDTSINALVPATATSGNIVVTSGNGQASNGVSFTIPPPSIASVNPITGRAGASITITGSNFGKTGGTVTFNGTTATPSSWSNTQIVTPVPSGATSGAIVVNAGGASGGVNFTVIPPPAISSISPSSGPVNSSITVSGVGFGIPQGTGTVKFNGTAGTPTSWSDGSIVVPVPPGSTTGPVVVTAGGINSNGVTFTVTGGPGITNLSPASGPSGTSVTVTGSNFGNTQGSSVARFNGQAASVSSWSANSIQATAPAGVTTGPVTVTVSGQTSNGVTFTGVTSGTLSGTVSNASGGAGISGASVQALQNGVVKSSTTTATDGTYSISSIPGGIYDIQASAGSFGTGLRNSVSVPAGQTTTVNFSLSAPATVSGVITQADGVTPIAGASVQALVGSAQSSKTTADANGNYSITGLNAASYSLQASATNYVTKSQTVTLSGGATTTTNLSLQATGVNPITYVYDELGRLISVSDSSGDTAVYKYDAVGNILSISRYSSGQVSIISFTPQVGPVGTSVTINGTGFSAAASQNTVQFNGVTATVTSATATQIVTSVPSGAITGPITVSAPGGSAVSTSNFTVGTTSGTPTITSFTPTSGTAGTAVTVTGTNFYAASNNKITFNITRSFSTSATTTQISTTVPASSGSGRISVTTPDGTGTSTQDFYIPFGSHVATDIGYTNRFSFGNSQTVTLSTANQIALLLFDAVAGQGASLQLSGSTFSTCTIYIFGPTGTQLTSSSCTSSTSFVDSVPLSTTGTYTVGIDPGSSTGSISVGLNGDFTSTITVPPMGQTGPAVRVPASGNLVAGQDGRLTFSGTTGQRLSFNVLNSTIGIAYYNCTLRVYDPSHTQITFGYCGMGASAYIDTVSLSSTGTYTIVIDPQATGSVSVSINNDSDVTGSIGIDGAAVTTTTTVAGQDARLSFSATAGQRIVVYATNVTNPGAYVYLVTPSGTNQTYVSINNSPAGQTFFIDTQTLATTGMYQLWVQHSGTNIGSETLQIASVPADFTGTLTVPVAGQTGPAVRVPASGNLAVGQNASLTFSGTTGQKLSFNVLNPTFGTVYYNCYLRVYDPSNTQITFGYCGTGASAYIDTVTLAATGTFTVLIDPQGTATGSVSVSINNDSDLTGTISIDGAAVTTTTTVAGQDARLSFSATAGQRIVVYATNVTNPGAYVYLVTPSGANQTYVSINNNPAGQTFFIDTQTLATTGTYQLWVQHSGTNIGSETLQIASVPADVSGSATIGGSAYSFTTVAGQNANITFSNAQSQSVTVHWTSSTYPSSLNCYMRVTGPSPSTSQVGFAYCNAATGTLSLGTQPSGTYNILVDPQQQSTGGLSLSVTTP